MNGDIRIVATRGDGLGQRLYAITNAIFVSKKTGYNYGFTWSDRFIGDADHAIDPAIDFFQPQYLQDHLVEPASIKGFQIPPGKHLTIEQLTKPLQDGSIVGWIATNSHLRNQLAPDLLPNAGYSLFDAFSEIQFSDRIQAIVDRARAAQVPAGCVALHLRAGDVVYGDYRKWGKFIKKTIPIPTTKLLLRHFQETGKPVLIFGQNKNATTELRRHFSIRTAADLYDRDDYSHVEQAVFDLILMTRCAEVISGSSGFALQASLVGGIPNKGILDYCDREAIMHFILADLENGGLDRYGDLDIATSYWYLWDVCRKNASFEQSLSWVQTAAKYDPVNPIYPLKAANILFHNKQYKAGDVQLGAALLANEAADEFASELFKLMRIRLSGTRLLEPELSSVEKAAALGLPNALAVSAMVHLLDGKLERARRMITDALLLQPATPAFLEAFRLLLAKEHSKGSAIAQ